MPMVVIVFFPERAGVAGGLPVVATVLLAHFETTPFLVALAADGALNLKPPSLPIAESPSHNIILVTVTKQAHVNLIDSTI